MPVLHLKLLSVGRVNAEDKLRQYLEDAAAVNPNLLEQFAVWIEEDDNEL